MFKRRLAQVMVAVMVAILAPLATSTPAYAACYTPAADPWGLALPQTQVNCSPGVVYYWTYDSRRHAFTINPSGQPIHTWRTCSTCAYHSSWVGLGGSATNYYKFINYTNASGGKAIEVSVVGTGGTKYCKNYNGNNAGSWYPSATTWTSSSSCLAFD